MNRKGIAVLLMLVLFLAAGAFAADEPVTSSTKVKFYGKIKGDLSYDDSRTSAGQYVYTVDSEDNNFQTAANEKTKPKDDGKFNATARETRLGFNFSGPKMGSADIGGKVEFDFYGGANNANNKGNIVLRHAYITAIWAESHDKLLVGQSWDIISPLNPTTLNYTVLWKCGNLGYRRAQASYFKDIEMGESTLDFGVGIFDNQGDSALTPVVGGWAAAPTLQGRVGYTFPTWAAKPTLVAITGHVGEMSGDGTAQGQHERYTTSSVNLSVSMPTTDWLILKGEVVNGRALGQFLGGIGNSIDTTMAHEVSSTGYWLAGTLGPWNKVSVNVGGGLDNPNENDMTSPAAGGATKTIQNQCIFGNILWKMNANLTFGLELSNWQTTYMNSTRAKHTARANRIQASAIYSFY
ncbi:DcaP family trimeric outer membrane transporter [Planctomycetota bacterium]